MYAVEIVEGKDHPPQKKKFANVAKNRSTTALLVLRLYEPIFHIGIVVILDSGSCVLRAIIELKKREVLPLDLIKKGDIGLSTLMATKLKSISKTRKLAMSAPFQVRCMIFLFISLG